MIIERRFHGPDGSGNGGYVAGRLAGRVPIDTVTVTLRRPPPLDTELRVTVEDERGHSARLWDGDRLVAEALAGAIVVPPIAAVPFEEALTAAEKYRTAENHPFPGCFVCGPEREPGDGLRLEPGPVSEGTVAAPWIPERVPERELVWAALDCPGGWSFDVAGRPAVLGTMTAQVMDVPEAGERCVVMGLARSREGRKMHAATALYGADGRLLGRAEQIWIEVDPETFGR
ncbi:hypothetical protein [Actinomadura citrea]|jgi:hypothetical protein|uniref:Thioesterase family protein n=1 Tax=Actinomadura citrea TaxID=46158 RepID=A0A7Y9GB92_9ACTN|nr:hypothetical protein [Actinomadura citrea]NYE13293.1 hypothetical protein [Actinomadura citrea]GGU05783.1 hypothetical protein GCM10010177_76450 [Actinomadura citrea]